MTPEEGVPPLFERYPWLERAIAKLHQSKQTFMEDDKVSRPKIQWLSHHMRERFQYETFYMPKLIAIGPIHSIDFRENKGEEHKLKWTSRYLEETNQTALDLFERIVYLKEELIKSFSGYGYREHIMWLSVLDGCSVLQVLDKSNHTDGEQELQVSVDQLVRIHQDLLLMENQIPFIVLKNLCNDPAKLKKCMDNFLQIHDITITSRTRKLDVGRKTEKENTSKGGEASQDHSTVTVQDEEDPVHLLDLLRRSLLRNKMDSDPTYTDKKKKQFYILNRRRRVLLINNKQNEPAQEKPKDLNHKRKSLRLRKYRVGSIRELKAAGIRVRRHPSNTSLYPNFHDGQLLLPEFRVDGSTAVMFLNLIGYEMCPDFRNNFEISSFVVFLSSLIDQPEDVKELRSAGILHNELASDKEVADLFNKMDAVVVPETAEYADITEKMGYYIESKRGRIKILGWLGEAYNTYFRSPWTIIALLAAAFGLALTFIQTWFAIHPKNR